VARRQGYSKDNESAAWHDMMTRTLRRELRVRMLGYTDLGQEGNNEKERVQQRSSV
jgi:hypothetical protein